MPLIPVTPWLQLGRDSAGPTIALSLEPSRKNRPCATAWDWYYIVNAPRQLAGGAPHHLQKRFARVTDEGPFKWHFAKHHLSH